MGLLRGSLEWYRDLYSKAQVNHDITGLMNSIKSNQKRYEAVSHITKVPWALIATIHNLECGLNFNGCMHNGDPLGKKTVHVPAGRGPFHTWEESAVDALKYDGLAGRDNWSVAKCLQFAEKYNGTGYLRNHPDVLSPYLWSHTTLYTKGKYVGDGQYDANAVSKQTGVAAVFLSLGIKPDDFLTPA